MEADLELLRLEVETSYVLDVRGRMVRRNEPLGACGDAFLVARTRTGVRWWIGADVADGLARRLDELGSDEAATQDWGAPPRCRDVAIELLGADMRERHGPAFVVSELPGSDAVAIDEHNAHLLGTHFEGLHGEIAERQPCYAVVIENRAVSVCFSSRVGAAACAAGAHTIDELRGRGLVGSAVAAWAAAVRRSGRVAFYGTTWDNHASRRVAAKLGMRLYADFWSVSRSIE